MTLLAAHGLRGAQMALAGWLAAGLVVTIVLGAAEAATNGPTIGEYPREFQPTALTGPEELADLARRRGSGIQAALAVADSLESEREQAFLWPNPTLDFTWGTIPLGSPNPPGLESPLLNVPSYAVGLSYLFEIGKRKPRQRRAEAQVRAARFDVDAAVRELALKIAAALGKAAAARVRQEGLAGLVAQARDSVEIARIRVRGGHGTPLEVDRAELELNRLEQQVLATRGEEVAVLAGCSALLGLRCRPFASGADARAFLLAWLRRAERPVPALEARPDLRALDAARLAAEYDAEVARASRIPDLTVRLGYVYDRFVVSGNQQHSLNLSISLPLPTFDRGEARRRAALARAHRLAAQRERLMAEARARLAALRRSLELQKRRQDLLFTRMLPRSRQVLADLQGAVSRGLLPVTDVIQARQTLNELTLAEADSLGDAFDTALEILGQLPLGRTPGAMK
jgi:cobalt-zinc-cadmium efflux system outer membrane protein